MYLNILFVLLLFFSAYADPVLTLRYSNGRNLDHIVLYKDYDSFPGIIQCTLTANWTLAPDLPKGMTFVGERTFAFIRYIPTEVSPETRYTLTAITSEGSVSVSFTMEVSSCESHKLYYVNTHDEVTFSYQGKNTSVYCSKWECLDPVIYDFSIPSVSEHFAVTIKDIDDVLYMHVEGTSNPQTGQLDLSDTLPPRVYSDTSTLIGTDPYLTKVSLTIINKFTTIDLYPPVGRVEVESTSLSISIDRHYECDHFIIVSNEHGSSSIPLHIIWYECKQHSYFSLVHYSYGSVNVTNSDDQELKVNDGYYCTNETEWRITTLGNAAENTWDHKWPLIIYDENGVFGEIFFPSTPSSVSFRYAVLVPDFSLLKYSFEGSDSWMNERFDDSSWTEKQGVFWGSFEKDVVYFRKVFNVEEIDGYNAMLIDIRGWGFSRVYLNGEEIGQLNIHSTYYSRLEMPCDKIRIGTNLVGISLEKTNDTTIIFDVSIRLVTLSEWIQSLSGIVRENQEHPTGHPEEAFVQDTSGSWEIESYPASLEIDYSKRNVIVNRFFMGRKENENGSITSIRIEGIDGDDVVNLYESERNGFMNEYTDYRLIDFDNSRGFPIYRITFLSEKNNSAMDISNIRLSRIMIPNCKKTWRLPETYPNHVVSKSCGLFYSGTKQLICKVEDYSSEWVEDESLCLSKLPPQGKSFVDFTLRLINLAYHSYNDTIRDRFVTMIVDNNAFVAKDMDLLLVILL